MLPSGHGDRLFQLGISATIAEAIRQLQRQASREDRGEEFLRAIRTTVERLRNDPMEFGEPLYYLPNLRLHVRTGAVRPLCVEFAVSEDRQQVFLKVVRLLAPGES
jgi:hypothetical protein